MTDPVREDEDLETDASDAGAGPDDSAREEEDESRAAEVEPEVPVRRNSKATSDTDTAGEETELVALREEFETLNDRHLRLAAEFNNFRRRSEQERLGAWSRAQADLVEKFIDVLDDLHRVAELDLSNATVETIMEGIDLVERKFVRMLADAGVDMIDPTGEPFDPMSMEAMMRVPAESDEQADTVAQVFQKGYSLKGILIRPARVSVYTQG